jgi:hypothetical protein
MLMVGQNALHTAAAFAFMFIIAAAWFAPWPLTAACGFGGCCAGAQLKHPHGHCLSFPLQTKS